MESNKNHHQVYDIAPYWSALQVHDMVDLISQGHRTSAPFSATLAIYFIFLVLGGHVLLPIALATFYATRRVVPRHPVMINLLVCQIVYATCSLLLLVHFSAIIHIGNLNNSHSPYAGQQGKPNPPFALCLTQASLFDGSLVLYVRYRGCLALDVDLLLNRIASSVLCLVISV